MKKIAITLGDPNGISPEITIKALNFLDLPSDKVILLANKNIFEYYEKNFSLSLEKNYEIVNIPFDINSLNISKETKEGGEFSFNALFSACNIANNNEVDAIVTAPVSKNALKMAGHDFSGQTEILEHYLAKENQKAQMLFVCEKYSVMLITRHIALNKVSDYIKKHIITEKIEILNNSLINQLKIKSPRLAICALNPHAGENGMFGMEEINEIIPAVELLKHKGIDIEGPFPADTLFTKLCSVDEPIYNCYIAMYHDQGLIPIKLLEWENCVNTTIGLNVLRTSPSHGTAYNIAGKNIANPNSMINAIKLALD